MNTLIMIMSVRVSEREEEVDLCLSVVRLSVYLSVWLAGCLGLSPPPPRLSLSLSTSRTFYSLPLFRLSFSFSDTSTSGLNVRLHTRISSNGV